MHTSGHVEPPPRGEYTLSVAFECEPARAEELQAQALSVVTGLRRQGPREADLQAVQQLWKRVEASPVELHERERLPSGVVSPASQAELSETTSVPLGFLK